MREQPMGTVTASGFFWKWPVTKADYELHCQGVPPMAQNCLNFMQFFRNFWQNCMLVPPTGWLVYLPQKSWICSWCTMFISISIFKFSLFQPKTCLKQISNKFQLIPNKLQICHKLKCSKKFKPNSRQKV